MNWDKDEREILERLAKTNYRGWTTGDLVCEVQALSEAKATEEDPKHKFFLTCCLNHTVKEFDRREKVQYNGINATNKNIITTIKEKIKLEDVIEWYAEVTVHQSRWRFKCPVHGDTNPSGVIYIDQQAWWCFGCNVGGDVFDAVSHFERVDMPTALRKLAKHLGLDLTMPKLKTDVELRIDNLHDRLQEHINPDKKTMKGRFD